INRIESGNAENSRAAKKTQFVLKAAEIAVAVLLYQNAGISGFEVETKSDPEFGFGQGKAGLGSSAAVTVATVGAIFEEFGKPVRQNLGLVHKTAQMAHSLAQGKVGSGFDVAASCFGSCRYVRYSPEIVRKVSEGPMDEIVVAINSKWDCIVESVVLPASLHVAIASFAGQSTNTSEMVKKAIEWKSSRPKEYAELIGKLDGENGKAINALQKRRLEDFKRHFVQGRKLTKALGEKSGAPIEPDDFSDLIAQSEGNGAFVAKLPGAGGGDAIAALCLTANDKKKLEGFWRGYAKKKLKVLDLGVSNEGVRKEERGIP
ncbi:hypothetical protein HY995_02115, partial [Candidatus Micrarchaeota archaeon]|nr:hypothetical protein [Candidatus Micrarchaeota archaeon]